MHVYFDNRVDSTGVIVNGLADAARAFSDLLTECECTWKMDWFRFLGRNYPTDLTDVIIADYCTENGLFDDECKHFSSLSKEQRETVLEATKTLRDAVNKVFVELFEQFNPVSEGRTRRTAVESRALGLVPGFADILHRFFKEKEDGTVELDTELYK